MNIFLGADVIDAVSVLTSLETQCAFLAGSAQMNSKACPRLQDTTHKTMLDCVEKLFSYSTPGAMAEKIQLSLFQLRTNSLMDASAIGTELRNIRETISTEYHRRKFLRIDPERAPYLNHAAMFGDKVALAFPSATADIREAGNCLAAECNTAAVFHLMRAVEWGLRALCADLGMKRVKSRIRKSGRVVYTPIEYSEWEKLLDQLQDRIDAKIQRLKRGSTKQELQQFYYPALQDIRGIRDAWRNHVMHTRDEYTHDDAAAILGHIRRLMTTLAGRIKEV
jgi:hypothetical protein